MAEIKKGDRHNIRVNGCANGLQDESPTLPVSRCNHGTCDWRIESEEDHYCSWVLFSRLQASGESLTLREVEDYLKINHERVRSIETRAVLKLKTVTMQVSTPEGASAVFGRILTGERESTVSHKKSHRYALMMAAMEKSCDEEGIEREGLSEVDDQDAAASSVPEGEGSSDRGKR